MKGKTKVVVAREFFGTIKRPSWLITTFGMPVFVGLYAGVIFLIGTTAAKMDKPTGKAGIVDRAGVVRFQEEPIGASDDIPAEAKDAVDEGLKRMAESQATGPAGAVLKTLLTGTRFVRFTDEKAGIASLDKKEIGALYVIPADYVARGKIVAYNPSESIISEGKIAQVPLRRLLIKSLAGDAVTPEVVARILSPVDITMLNKTPEGEWKARGVAEIVRRIGVPLGFTIMLLISILMSAGTLIQGVSEEKENRVIEVILSSIDARSLLLGKLLGLGAAGLLQLAIWLSMALVPAVLLVAGLALSPMTVIRLCTSRLRSTARLSPRPASQPTPRTCVLRDVLAIGCALPMPFLEVLLRDPNGTTAHILSFFPLSTAVTMMIRIGTGTVPWWEVPLTLATLAISVGLTLRFAARLFRTALLMYGKRPTLIEIFRTLRQA